MSSNSLYSPWENYDFFVQNFNRLDFTKKVLFEDYFLGFRSIVQNCVSKFENVVEMFILKNVSER